MSVEKLQILEMVRDGKISTEEGVKLLEALDNNKTSDEANSQNKKAKWIKIKVFSPDDDKKVNVTLPISLISIGVKLAEKFSPEIKASGLTQDDMDEILNAIKSGATGKIVDIDGENGEKVEIVIE